jgi:hypothetical protein
MNFFSKLVGEKLGIKFKLVGLLLAAMALTSTVLAVGIETKN